MSTIHDYTYKDVNTKLSASMMGRNLGHNRPNMYSLNVPGVRDSALTTVGRLTSSLTILAYAQMPTAVWAYAFREIWDLDKGT